jgi:hypothetical protein
VISLSSWSHFAPTVGSRFEKPVMLPPGCAKLCTMPWVTGSLTVMNTTGTAGFSCCSSLVAGVPTDRTTSGRNLSNSAGAIRARSPTTDHS